MTFKVGDKVRLIDDHFYHTIPDVGYDFKNGVVDRVGTVGSNNVFVKFGKRRNPLILQMFDLVRSEGYGL